MVLLREIYLTTNDVVSKGMRSIRASNRKEQDDSLLILHHNDEESTS
ncbi:hypothetical protein SynMITS9220_01547 [Synechococcus sp. MIT S9220]|nr:hypothetical protein SynMITS9220_01547 [Synechococcus sp. MIT S9220]